VTDKLDRGWALRRVLIGATGVVAGVAAAVPVDQRALRQRVLGDVAGRGAIS
jgi:hypothetical protein